MRFGKDDSLPTGMLIIAACLYVYSHGVSSSLAHGEQRAALSSVFPLAVEYNKPDNNRVFVTHGRLPPRMHKRLVEERKEQQRAARRQAEMQTSPL